jgi:H+/Cl- antiporter ClcA
VPRNDPTDTGGLFIGRRPGTAPVRYRTPPERGSAGRRRVDALLAAAVLVVEALVVLSAWGPQPVAWMWVGSQLDHLTGSVFLGIVAAFAGLIGSLILTLMLATRLDHLWRLLRRAAGHDQREGVVGRLFMITAIVAAAGFTVWFLLLEGPGSSIAPH